MAAVTTGKPTASWWNQNPGSPATGPINLIIFSKLLLLFIFTEQTSTYIKNFQEKYLAKQNRKIQSICADNKCDQVDCHATALGLLYFRVTGPYWELLAQDIHYLDFCMSTNCFNISRDGLQTLQMPSARNLIPVWQALHA